MEGNALNLAAVIMAGGAGTRFWPLSNERRPKQFLALFGERSLLQSSYDRISNLVPPHRTLILTNAAFVDLVREQLPEVPAENVIGEPFRRDTAAAVCLGALLCLKRFDRPVIVTLTADHMIEPVDVFQKTMLSAARLARQSGALYTFGIPPSHPATGYGYLELGPKVADDEGIEHFRLLSFREKPDRETAERYLDSGSYYWNSGMFVWTAEAVLSEIEKHLPEHARAIAEAVKFDRTPNWSQALSKAFKSLQTISIDYGVMEKVSEVRCVGSTFSWSDVGGWQALADHLPQDADGNCCRGELMALEAADNLVFCEDSSETVMLVGVQDLVAIRAGKKTLIARKDMTEMIKKLVQDMQPNE